MIHGTIAENRWGINLGSISCPRCTSPLSQVRTPRSFRQALWGGYICPACRAEVDKWGAANKPTSKRQRNTARSPQFQMSRPDTSASPAVSKSTKYSLMNLGGKCCWADTDGRTHLRLVGPCSNSLRGSHQHDACQPDHWWCSGQRCRGSCRSLHSRQSRFRRWVVYLCRTWVRREARP